MGEISRLLSAGGDAAFPNFLEAFTQTVFSQYNKDNRVSVVGGSGLGVLALASPLPVCFP